MATLTDREYKEMMITAYRAQIERRYAKKELKARYELREGLKDKDIEALRQFFLTYVYPPFAQREFLQEAFDGLKTFIDQPKKVVSVLGNMAGIMFKLGFHFAEAIQSSMVSMQAFMEAQKFERLMIQSARDMALPPDFSEEAFMRCLCRIPRQDAERFLQQVEFLFRSFFKTELVRRIVVVLRELEEAIKDKPDLFSVHELEGLQFGINVLEQGGELFARYNHHQQEYILSIIMDNERVFLDEVYAHVS